MKPRTDTIEHLFDAEAHVGRLHSWPRRGPFLFSFDTRQLPLQVVTSISPSW